MTEPAVKSNQRMAAQLFERGVAAARSGQRRLAAGLLARAVQCDPRHEQAWLWLSGVVDDPEQIVFCLRTVLEIDPDNDRARRGLAWLEQRSPAPESPRAVTAPARAPEQNGAAHREDNGHSAEGWWTRIRTRLARPTPAPAYEPHHEAGSWWVAWRRSHQEMSRARLLLWLVPLLLLLLTLGMNYALRDAIVARNAQIAEAAAREATQTNGAAAPEPPPPPILQMNLQETQEARALAYLSALSEPRARLRGEVEAYRAATSRPGNSAVVHATAARKLRDQVAEAHAQLAALTPPPVLEAAHADYLAGLEVERQALDDMLQFYGSFSVQLANRAAIRMAEASQLLDRARAGFDRAEGQLTSSTRNPHTAR